MCFPFPIQEEQRRLQLEQERQKQENARIEEEQKRREEEKMQQIQEEEQLKEKERLLRAAGKEVSKFSREDIKAVDKVQLQEELEEKRRKKLEEEQKRREEKSKRLDYLVRAIRETEQEKLDEWAQKKLDDDEAYVKEQQEAIYQREKEKHDKSLKIKHRLSRVLPYRNEFENRVMERRRASAREGREHERIRWAINKINRARAAQREGQSRAAEAQRAEQARQAEETARRAEEEAPRGDAAPGWRDSSEREFDPNPFGGRPEVSRRPPPAEGQQDFFRPAGEDKVGVDAFCFLSVSALSCLKQATLCDCSNIGELFQFFLLR
eukprot:gb/GECG01016022.1/.p1 GENE.gb/GECG01016022.1/~~gb/GECG01016022.1/.p1  ORF type:complete len:323 (+),score=91.46 gb/GECG01016022.1/:1-969(+)